MHTIVLGRESLDKTQASYLQVSSTYLNYMLKSLSLFMQCIPEIYKRGNKRHVDFGHGGDMHGGWEAERKMSNDTRTVLS